MRGELKRATKGKDSGVCRGEGPGSNSSAVLAELAERARRTYGESVAAWIATAYTLAEAREICPHGRWGAFLAECGIPERTARNMVRLARAGIKSATVADLGGLKSTLTVLSRNPEVLEEIASNRAEIERLQAEYEAHRSARLAAEAECATLRKRIAEAEAEIERLERGG